MSAFSSIDIARTGAGFSNYWLSTLAHNMANVNTVRAGDEDPFRARLVVAQEMGDHFAPTGSGVGVRALVEADGEPQRVHDPDHPLADDEGYVVRPLVDLAGQMADLVAAQRSYQANLRVVQTSKEAYESALRLGQR